MYSLLELEHRFIPLTSVEASLCERWCVFFTAANAGTTSLSQVGTTGHVDGKPGWFDGGCDFDCLNSSARILSRNFMPSGFFFDGTVASEL